MDRTLKQLDADAAPLWDAYKRTAGDGARNALWLHYQPLLRSVIRRLCNSLSVRGVLDSDDLYSHAQTGLLDAIKAYEPASKVAFRTYSTMRIRGGALDAIRDIDWVPRLERVRQRKGVNINAPKCFSLDEPLAKVATDRTDREEISRASVIEDVRQSVEPFANQDFWKEAVKGLGKRESLMVQMYYRMDMTMHDIGCHLGISESRISQLFKRVLRLIGDRMKPDSRNIEVAA